MIILITLQRILLNKGALIPLFSVTFDTKYRAENFTDTDTNSI